MARSPCFYCAPGAVVVRCASQTHATCVRSLLAVSPCAWACGHVCESSLDCALCVGTHVTPIGFDHVHATSRRSGGENTEI